MISCQWYCTKCRDLGFEVIFRAGGQTWFGKAAKGNTAMGSSKLGLFQIQSAGSPAWLETS